MPFSTLFLIPKKWPENQPEKGAKPTLLDRLLFPGPVVEVDVEPVDAAVVGVDGDVARQVLAAGPALALQLGQPPAQHAGGRRVVRVVPGSGRRGRGGGVMY